MSWQATNWALRDAPVGSDCVARLLLVSLGDYARPDGTGAYPSVATLMKLCGKSESTVRRKLAWMESIGVIVRGDQSAVARIPANRRPVVWNLRMDAPAIPVDDRLDESGRLGCQNDTPESAGDGNADFPTKPRGVRMTPQSLGVSKKPSRGGVGDTSRGGVGDTQTINKYNQINQPLKPPEGAAAAVDDPDDGFSQLRRLWPKKSGRPKSLRRLWDAAKADVGAQRVLSSAKSYVETNRDVPVRYQKGLKAWLSDPACYSSASLPSSDGDGAPAVTPMAAARAWYDRHDTDCWAEDVDASLYSVACLVRSHPDLTAGQVPGFLDRELLGVSA